MSLKKQDLEPHAGFSSNRPARSALLLDLEDGFSDRGIRHRKRAHFRRSLLWLVGIWAASALRRLSDAVLAALLMVTLSPVILVLLIAAKMSGGGVRERPRLGRWATHFRQYEFYFPSTSFLSHFTFLQPIPALYNVLKGEMSFIGPRAASPDEIFAEERMAWKRYNLRPGLLSLWWLRKRANIAYTSEVGLDVEYVETSTLWGDLGIAARAIPAVFFGDGVSSSAPPQIRFLGVQIDNLTMAEASARIVALTQAAEASQICFVNADCVNIAFTDEHYRATLSEAQLVLADGIGVRLAGSILNQNVRENINGTDMLPFLCAAAEQANVSVYLLGGKSGVPEGAAQWMTERYPRLRIAGCRQGYFTAEEEPQIVEEIKASGADILLVALGTPRQDKWIAAHKDGVGAKVSIGVGGLFDFYSGRIPRAPVWVREIGMEWFYRFYQEPRRMWRRYFLGNAIFLYRVACERIRAQGSQRTGGVAS
jgi:N-acetylglucosaminyldiphosphoundecaprenol N-acetyl-beta-D-mannosaminyltransferase